RLCRPVRAVAVGCPARPSRHARSRSMQLERGKPQKPSMRSELGPEAGPGRSSGRAFGGDLEAHVSWVWRGAFTRRHAETAPRTRSLPTERLAEWWGGGFG